MIPAPFGYVVADTVDSCVAALAEHGDDARVLAGGHSLLPAMKLRTATPSVLVDIGRIRALRGVVDAGDHLRIGATTTHADVAGDPLVRRECLVLALAAATIADPQVRHRGTIGGALAHGDPAGDLPAVMLALEAAVEVVGPQGPRDVAASELFVDRFVTALAPTEVVTAVRVPKLPAAKGWGHAYEKFTRAAHMWAIVGSCAVIRTVEGAIVEARVGLTNMGSTPRRASATEAALRAGGDIGTATALADDATDPPSDLNAATDYRRHLARALTRRAVTAAIG